MIFLICDISADYIFLSYLCLSQHRDSLTRWHAVMRCHITEQGLNTHLSIDTHLIKLVKTDDNLLLLFFFKFQLHQTILCRWYEVYRVGPVSWYVHIWQSETPLASCPPFYQRFSTSQCLPDCLSVAVLFWWWYRVTLTNGQLVLNGFFFLFCLVLNVNLVILRWLGLHFWHDLNLAHLEKKTRYFPFFHLILWVDLCS